MRADAREKRQAILGSAWRLVAEHGPDVPMRTVATDAQVGIATLYRHFPTPDSLIVGLFEQVRDNVLRVLEQHDDGWDDDPVATWNATVLELAHLGFGALAYQIAPIMERSDALQTELLRLRKPALKELGKLLDRAKAHRLVGRDLELQQFFVGLATISRPLPPHVEKAMPGHRDWMISVYVKGLRP